MKRFTTLLLILLALVPLDLSAATLEARYVENFNTTIHNSSEYGIQGTHFPVALHVGTLTIDLVGGGGHPSLYSIQLKRSGDYDEGDEYELESTKEINYQDEFGAQLIAKTMFGGKTIVKTINWKSGEDRLMEEREFESGPYPITVEFYLGIRNIHNAGQAQGVGFQFEDDDGPNLGNFKVRYRTTPWSGSLHTIPFSGGEKSIPYFSINYNEDSPNYLNGTILDKSVYVSLAIEQTPSEASINIADAAGTSRAKVGQARLTLTGYEKPNNGSVYITFTDGNGSTGNDFRLKHSALPSFIPFSLYLAGEKVDNGVRTKWDNLAYGRNNLKDLHVGNMEQQGTALRMSGLYSDTITINITPVDSSLVGQ